jgi:hypothetical protein
MSKRDERDLSGSETESEVDDEEYGEDEEEDEDEDDGTLTQLDETFPNKRRRIAN